MQQELVAPLGVRCPEPGEMVALVAEPGMAKTRLAKHLHLAAKGGTPRSLVQLYLSDTEGDLVARIEGLRREVAGKARRLTKHHIIALVDNFPSAEEDVLARVAELFRGIARRGASLVLTMRPEAEQLLDYLPEAQVVRAESLLFRLPHKPEEPVLLIWQLSNGIPNLVEALEGEPDGHSARYLDALRRLVAASLRSGIPQAEREARLAMLLLGAGSLEQLREVAPGADDETLQWLASEAPLFGIDLYGATFACAGMRDAHSLHACYGALRQIGAGFDEVIASVFEQLLAQGDYVRAGICCSLVADRERRAKLAIRQGAELALAGAARVVRDGVLEAQRLSMQEEPGYASSMLVLGALEQPYSECAIGGTPQGVRRKVRQHVELVLAMRAVDAGLSVRQQLPRGDDRLVAVLCGHVSAWSQILQGQPSAALNNLALLPTADELSSVADMLLASDTLIASLLCTRLVRPGMHEWIDRSRHLLRGSQLRRLATYEGALADVAAVLAGGKASSRIDQAIYCAELAEDRAIRAALLMLAGISDLRRGELARAHVRLVRAVEESEQTSFAALVSAVRLLRAFVAVVLGEEGSVVALIRGSQLTGIALDLACLAVAAGCDSGDEDVPALSRASQGANNTTPCGLLETLSPVRLDRDALWLTYLLASDFGSLSAAFVRFLPPAWRRSLAQYGECPQLAVGEQKPAGNPPSASESPGSDTRAGARNQQEAREGGSPQPDALPKAPPGARSAMPLSSDLVVVRSAGRRRVRLSLLGGFCVRVDGHMILPEHVSRRRARVVLALLATRETHTMRRIELIDDVWGTLDLEAGTQRLYEAISSTRQVLNSRNLGFDPFVLRRGPQTISLNEDVVECDIDDFVREAGACLSSEGRDEDVVDHACLARDLYVGDLDDPLGTGLPWVQTRQEQLRDSFVDAMVAGARSALRISRGQLALSLIQAGYSHDDLREDVMATLIECLCLANRTSDAHDAYLRYTARVVSMTSAPPSRELRLLAARLAGVGDELAGADLALHRLPSLHTGSTGRAERP